MSKQVEAVALLRRVCQHFDTAGESERSFRARCASAAFQLLYADTPEQQAAFDECDRDPVTFLRRVTAGCICEHGHDRPYWTCPAHGYVVVDQ